ncbi:MAG: NAD(P)-dependent oxidoreductase [Kiloniellaceae bacterium]
MNPAGPPRGVVSLTGGSGFVGGHILRRLLADGWRVKALTRRLGGPPERGAVDAGTVTPVLGDLASKPALAELVTGADAVIHCAGLVAARRAGDFERVNTQGTANLLDALRAAGRSLRVIQISSLAAREPHLSPYARSKRQAEDLLKQNATDLDWQILRPPVVYGPGDRATLPLFRQFARGLALRPSGQGRFSMIYVDDLAAAAVCLLSDTPAPGQTLELDDGTAEGYDWPAVLAAAERQFGRRIRALAVPQPAQRLAAALSQAGAAVTGRAPLLSQGKVNEISHPDWVCHGKTLGDCISWRPKVGLDEGFSKTIAWYKAAGWL